MGSRWIHVSSLIDVIGWVNRLDIGWMAVLLSSLVSIFPFFGSPLDGWPYCTSCSLLLPARAPVPRDLSSIRFAVLSALPSSFFLCFSPLTDWTDSDCLCVFPWYLYCPYNTAPPTFRFSAATSVQMTHVYTGARLHWMFAWRRFVIFSRLNAAGLTTRLLSVFASSVSVRGNKEVQ